MKVTKLGFDTSKKNSKSLLIFFGVPKTPFFTHFQMSKGNEQKNSLPGI